MSDFFGLQVGLSALYASRKAMEVAASNVANANVDGYSRQRVTVSSAGAPLTASVHARSESQLSGVKVDAIIRTRDDFLQTRLQSEHANQKFFERSQTILNRIELTFAEPSDTGIQAQLSDFWASWEDLANNPGSLATRSQLVERAGTVVNSINQASGELGELWRTSTQQLETMVKGVNATAARVAELNGSIKRALVSGLSPNELLDQRDQLALELAQQVGGEVRTDKNGTVGIFVGGTAVVRDEQSSDLAVFIPTGSNIISANDSADMNVQLRWAKDNFRATVGGGEAGALLDAINRVLPSYREALIGSGPPQGASSPVIEGDPITPPATNLTGRSFVMVVDGASSLVTMQGEATDPAPSSPGALAAAVNEALGKAGVSDVIATALPSGDDWQVNLTSLRYGEATEIEVQASLGDASFAGEMFGTSLGPVAGTGAAGQEPGLAYRLAQATNLAHRQGVDLDRRDAGDFFTWTAADGIKLAITDSTTIGAASHSEGKLGGGNALNLADLSLMPKGPDDSYRNMIIKLGVDAQTANRRVDIQANITNQIEASRDAESGVNIDEEMAFMVAFQHSYAAASRLITAIDQMLTRLIDGTGLVGR